MPGAYDCVYFPGPYFYDVWRFCRYLVEQVPGQLWAADARSCSCARAKAMSLLDGSAPSRQPVADVTIIQLKPAFPKVLFQNSNYGNGYRGLVWLVRLTDFG